MRSAARLAEQEAGGLEGQAARRQALDSTLRESPIAVATDAANAQHYEVPAAFFELVLGPHLKYSSGYWPTGVTTLAEAETRMLEPDSLGSGNAQDRAQGRGDDAQDDDEEVGTFYTVLGMLLLYSPVFVACGLGCSKAWPMVQSLLQR